MSDTRTVKKIFNWKPLTKRSQGKHKYRWQDSNKQDICQMKIRNWISRIEGSGKRSLRRPKLSTRKFSAWKKKRWLRRGGSFPGGGGRKRPGRETDHFPSTYCQRYE